MSANKTNPTAEEMRDDRERKETQPDPFNPDSMRLSQDCGELAGGERVVNAVPVRKPSKEWYFRVRPESEFRVQTGVLELKEDREVYLVPKNLWSALSSEATFGPRCLFTAVNRQGLLFLWPVRLPGIDGRLDSWNRSALDAAELGMKDWIRLVPNMGLGGYDVYRATSCPDQPVWPDLSFRDILQIAFKNYLIEDLNHPVLKRLRGEV